MPITSKGQVTIPQAIREQAGLLPGCEVEFVIEDGTVRLMPAKPRQGPSRGEQIERHLRGSARSAVDGRDHGAEGGEDRFSSRQNASGQRRAACQTRRISIVSPLIR